MKALIEKLIRSRNPRFRFDDQADSYIILQFFLVQIRSILRGYKVLCYGRLPKTLMLGAGVRFRYMRKIRWGRFLKLGEQVFISALGSEGVRIGDNVGIGAFSRVIVSTSLNQIGQFIRIGNNVGIGEFAYLGGAGGLEIGDDCIIGQYLSCHPEDHIFQDTGALIRLQGVTRKGIKVGRNCWIGSKVTLLDGVVIGDGCVIAAGAVVTRSMPANCVIGGVPARIIRSRDLSTSSSVSSAISSNKL